MIRGTLGRAIALILLVGGSLPSAWAASGDSTQRQLEELRQLIERQQSQLQSQQQQPQTQRAARDRCRARPERRRVLVDRLNTAGTTNLTPFGPAPATHPLGVQVGQDLDIYALRSQFSF